MILRLVFQIKRIAGYKFFKFIGRHTMPFQMQRVLGVPIELNAAAHCSLCCRCIYVVNERK